METPIKVLLFPQIHYALGYAGIEIQQDHTIEALINRGVQVTKVDLWQREITENIAHVFGSEIGTSTIVERLRASAIPVVVTAMFMPVHTGITYAVAQAIGNVLPKTTMSLRKATLNLANAIITLTETEKQQLISLLKIDARKIHVIANGIDERFFRATPDLFYQRTGLKDVILSVGSIDPRKNQVRLIEALAGTGVDLVFIGPVSKLNTPQFHRYKERFHELVKTNTNVHWLGALDYEDPLLESAYAAAQVHVLVSTAEAQGMVTLEAAAAGANIVVSDLPTQRELFGASVRYADCKNPDAIRREVLAAYHSPRGSVQPPSNVMITWDEVAARLENVYRMVLNNG